MRYESEVIGTYSGTTSLVINFNSGFATPDAVQALLRQISFRTPTVGLSATRAVTASLTDGDSGTSTLVYRTIQVRLRMVWERSI